MTDSYKVLLLGAGLVSKPVVSYFLALEDCRTTVSSLYLEDAERLVGDHPRGRATSIDVSDDVALAPLVAEADVVISLVPYALHPRIARHCIEAGTHLVTASYTSPEMRTLDGHARERGVALLNELGFDPGFDHMTALRLIRKVRERGGRVRSFVSCAGGLPDAEAANNPWNYKFSWSPRGVLLAALADARFRKDGEVCNWSAEEVFANPMPYTIEGLGDFEMYVNRDAIKYAPLFGLERAETMIRGTIRYPGWCETIRALDRLQVLDETEHDWIGRRSFADWTRRAVPDGQSVAEFLGIASDHAIIERLQFAGLLDEEKIPAGRATAIDRVADRMQARMSYEPGERDMVIVRHEIEAYFDDGRPDERHVSLFVDYGDPQGDTGMAKAVSYPAAVAADLLLRGGIDVRGVHVPTDWSVAGPVLERLETMGLRAVEQQL